MIPLLLWRCPLCATDDALEHQVRCFRADRVRCRRCRAEWRVRRVPGDNFYLKLVAGQACPELGRGAGILPDMADERSRSRPANGSTWPPVRRS
jgi:hypothetical protein